MHEQSAVTSVLIGEALAHGDMGIAYAALAPGAVATAIGLWGSAEQEATYLPAFTGEDVPAAALAILEPRPLFDPLKLETTARKRRRRMGPRRRQVAARPGQGVRAVRDRRRGRGDRPGPVRRRVRHQGPLGRSRAGDGPAPRRHRPPLIEGARLPAGALLGEGEPRTTSSASTAPGSPGAALAVGTAQAVLDYVIPYVNERRPSANRSPTARRSPSPSPTSASRPTGCGSPPTAPRAAPTAANPSPARRLLRVGSRRQGHEDRLQRRAVAAATASSRSTRSSAGTGTCAQRA